VHARVKWFNDEKGFGFLEYEDGKDIFIHYSSIISKGYKTLKEGDIVSFELVETDKGYQAKNVLLVKEKVNM